MGVLKKMVKSKFILFVILLLLISNVSALTILSSSTNPSVITQGGSATLTLVLDNALEDDLENIRISLDLSNPQIPISPIESSTEVVLDKLDEGEQRSANFNIIILPGAKAGIYKIPVNISYFVEGQNVFVQKTELIGVQVNSDPKLRVVSEGLIIQNLESKIEIKIVNEGLSDINYVSVELSDIPGLRVVSSKYEYLGTIESDDFDSVEFTMFSLENFGSLIALPVIIKYRDALNHEFTKQEIVLVPVYTQEEAQRIGLVESPNYIYLLIPILIIGFLIYRSIKKKRKKKVLER